MYLSNDKAERKASGSYYTPDPIVEYIVAQTVGPVLEEKLERLRPEFRKVRKTFDRQLANARDPRIHSPANQQRDVRAEAADKTYAEHRGLFTHATQPDALLDALETYQPPANLDVWLTRAHPQE